MENTNMETKNVKTKNEAEIVGILKENKLKIEKDRIMGSLVIQYGDDVDQQAEVSVFVNRKKKDGEVNKKYAEMLETNAKLVSQPLSTEEKPTSTLRIYGNGDFTPNIDLYERYNENTDSNLSDIQISMGFGKIYIGDIPKEQFKGEFDMIIYLTKDPAKEVVKGKKTKRLALEGIFITYMGAIKPISFVVEDEELIEGLEECEKGQTINVWGSCKVAQITKITTKKSGFGGKAKTDETSLTFRELIVEGGDPISEDSEEAIESSVVKAGLAERETFLKELKNKAKSGEKASKGKGGFGGNGGDNKDKNADIPF